MPLPHISAWEPSALRWSMNHSQRLEVGAQHRRGVGHVVGADQPEDAVAAEAGPAVAQAADHRRIQAGLGPDGAVGVGQHDEVVLGAMPDEHPGAGGVTGRSYGRRSPR